MNRIIKKICYAPVFIIYKIRHPFSKNLSIGDIKYDVILYRLKYPFFRIKYEFIKNYFYDIKIFSIEETIENIIKKRCSVCRFGDGEFKWMTHISQNSFQNDSEVLSERLVEILQSNEKNILVCITPAFNNLNGNMNFSKKYWIFTMAQYGKIWIKYLDKNRKYYNANMSRFYIDMKDKARSKNLFFLVKKIWDKKDILIVEGSSSRLGIGNDLFNNAKSIKRLIAPSKNAFDTYLNILNKSKFYGKNKLILIALGPTATVLAYDLALNNYQAIDIGHIDIEYEWFLMKATKKVPVPGRYVNEATKNQNIELSKLDEQLYISQIVDRII